jgi:hypothetical protein
LSSPHTVRLLMLMSGLVKDRMATREGQKFFSKNPTYTLDKSRSHTSDGSNHTPIAKTTRL